MSDLINREDAIEAVNETIAQYIPYLTRETIGIPLEVALAIKRLPSANQWIKCSDRLPFDGLRVVMLLDNAWELVGWYDLVDKEWFELPSCMPTEYEVIAWLPLPQYESEEE